MNIQITNTVPFLQLLNWLSMEVAAPAIIEMVDSPTSTSIVHLVHPSPVRWSELMQHISHTLCLPMVPYSRWLAALEVQSESNNPNTLADSSPALKLLGFFQYSSTRKNSTSNFLEPSVSCRGALDVSETLRNARSTPLGLKDVEAWLCYWRSVGFIPSTRSVNGH